MDKFNVIWCALWSDYFMTQHQYDKDSVDFQVTSAAAADFLFYLKELLGYKKDGFYSDEEKDFVFVTLSNDEIEKITDWIIEFNFALRRPANLMLPDLYLGEEKIALSTVNVYCQTISDFILCMINNQQIGRNEIADWATQNFAGFYLQAQSESIKLKSAS